MAVAVFMVEDSPLVRSALEDLFEISGGFEVVGSASSEMRATQWLLEHPGAWDLATVDLMLEEGSGFNLVRRSKLQPGAGTVVVLSDYVTPAVAERCIALGADAVFMKSQAKELVEFLSRFALEREARSPAPAAGAKIPFSG